MVEIKIEVEEGFELEKAVCNHGLFMMMPNQWDPLSKSLHRPLRLPHGHGHSSVLVSLSSSSSNVVLIQVHDHPNSSLSLSDQLHIQKQVRRMLRLTKKGKEDVRRFQETHKDAKNKGFGRLFRSPDLFEDVLKTILLCGVTWKRTLEMCEHLCELQAELESGMHKANEYCRNNNNNNNNNNNDSNPNNFFRTCKRKHNDHPSSSSRRRRRKGLAISGNFPNAKELAGLSKELLEKQCKLGYRAKYILQIAKMVYKGRLRLPDDQFEDEDTYNNNNVAFFEEVRKKLLKVKGIGPFAATNILMCMGDYRYIPTDSETVLHLRQVHGMKNCHKDTVEKDAPQVFDKFGPYQCLAYWYEQVESYEKKLGQKLSELSPKSYHQVATGSYLSNNTSRNKQGAKTPQPPEQART